MNKGELAFSYVSTFRLPPELGERLDNAIYWLSGPPHRLTKAAFMRAAVEAAVRKLEKQHNGGQPFKPRVE